jgi:hypothetical protein
MGHGISGLLIYPFGGSSVPENLGGFRKKEEPSFAFAKSGKDLSCPAT